MKNAAKPFPGMEFRLRGTIRMVNELITGELKEIKQLR